MALFDNYFYHGMTKNYTLAMGSLFSNISVVRKDENGDEEHRIVVPLTYSPKEKFIQRLTQDPDHSRKPAITLPRIAFELASLNYDGQRKLQKLRKYKYSDGASFDAANKLGPIGGPHDQSDSGTAGQVYTPVPYDLIWNFYIVTKTQDEMLQIIEQILPAFTPDFTIAMRGMNGTQDVFDVPITLLDIQPTDTFEGMFEERRQIMWSLSFLMKAIYFGPILAKSIILYPECEVKEWLLLFDDEGDYHEIPEGED